MNAIVGRLTSSYAVAAHLLMDFHSLLAASGLRSSDLFFVVLESA